MDQTRLDRSTASMFRDCGVMSLADGFKTHEFTKDRTGDWRFSSLGDVAREEFRSTGFHYVTALNIVSFLKFRGRNRPDVLEEMRTRFVYELSVGLVEAVGYLLPRAERDKPVLIPKQVWEHGHLDWDRAEIAGAGFKFTYVRILMPYASALLKGSSYHIEPMPELAQFVPSEEQRLALDLPSGLPKASPVDPNKAKRRPGRTSHRTAIIQAFDEINKDPTWQNKPLVNAVRTRAKEILGQAGDENLSHDTIITHVGPLWDEFRARKN